MRVPQSGSLTQAYAYIGAPALSLSNLTLGGGVLFEVRFDAATFAGDLIARGVAADGSFTPDEFDAEGNLTAFNGLWRARTTVTAQSKRRGDSATDNRIIFTAGDDGTGIIGRPAILVEQRRGRCTHRCHEGGHQQ